METFQRRVLIVGIIAVVVIVATVTVSSLLNRRLATEIRGRTDVDGTGEKIATVAYEAEVVSWEPESGTLKAKVAGKTRDIKIRLPETVVVIAASGMSVNGSWMNLVPKPIAGLYCQVC